MRALRKTKNCLNCKTPLDDVYNYCPICGQQNDDKNVSFRELGKDLFENFFSFDSRLAHTFFPFFFKPGELTKKYNEGKRFTYANPIRLYIIVSFFYFFVLNILMGDLTRELSQALDSPEVDSVQNVFQKEMEFNLDSIKNAPPVMVRFDEDSLEDSADVSWPLEEWQWKMFNQYMDDNSVSEEALFDSLQLENRHALTQLTVKQIIRIYKRDKELLVSQIVKNLSVMMFVLIPVFALLLKLMYIRRKTLYINHLIHTIHLHTFAFFVYGLMMAIMHWMVQSDNAQNWMAIGSLSVVFIYSFLSFKMVYGQSWKKTFLKYWITAWLYFYILVFAIITELLISLLIF
ncbi:MAG: DUF3667 domain-containing protein [Reichenbachiella sp.]|uniref:DUF3667 domain-containing protein n=1 Tax=Reichenbachiella sp. TaxID=2184521 RepID=UPI003297B4AD